MPHGCTVFSEYVAWLSVVGPWGDRIRLSMPASYYSVDDPNSSVVQVSVEVAVDPDPAIFRRHGLEHRLSHGDIITHSHVSKETETLVVNFRML